MSEYAHLTADERDRLAALKAEGLSLRAIARAFGRAASTISRGLRRNALDSGAYRPHVADGAYPQSGSVDTVGVDYTDFRQNPARENSVFTEHAIPVLHSLRRVAAP